MSVVGETKGPITAYVNQIVALEDRLTRVRRLARRQCALKYAQAQRANDAEEENEKLKTQIKALRDEHQAVLAVGDGRGSLFLYGKYEAVKAGQGIILKGEKLRSCIERTKDILEQSASDPAALVRWALNELKRVVP